VVIDLRLGDCLEVLKTLPAGCVDAVVTDPPYIGLRGGMTQGSVLRGVADSRHQNVTVGELWGNDLTALSEIQRVARYGAIVFCSWSCVAEIKTLLGGAPVGLLTWYKRNSQPSMRNRPWYQTEHAWLIEYAPGMNWKPLRTLVDVPGLPAGCMATERVLQPGSGKAAHPTQKPLALIRELLQACGQTVLDPFMGSGTTGVACVQTGRNFIGCEIDPTYYAIAEKRIAQAQEQMRLLEVA
jgi:DNA modification methylase